MIEFLDVTLDFPVKGGAPTYLKEQVTGRFRKDGRRSRFRALDKVRPDNLWIDVVSLSSSEKQKNIGEEWGRKTLL